MNSGQSSTKLNDMLIEFTNYVNDFYGEVDDVLYPMNHMETGERLSLKDILSACLLYTSPSPRDRTRSRMPSSA